MPLGLAAIAAIAIHYPMLDPILDNIGYIGHGVPNFGHY